MLSGSGVPGPAQVVTTSVGALRGVQTFEIMGGAVGSVAVLSTWNKAGFSIYGLTGKGALDFAGAIADTAKSYVANVSDTATVTLGGQDYLLTLSSLENGLTCYVIGADRKAALIDSLGNHDGLWVSGPAALRTVAVDGVTYAVIAATGSSSLSVVRVNAMGCLFVTDHVVDDRTTRFAHPEVLDIFTLQGRSFVVSAGTDAGITMMELLPGGRLSAFSTVVLETGAGLAAVKGLEVALDGTQLKLFVVDARADRIQTFGMSLASLGGVVKAVAGLATGTAQDDLILGSAASEVLRGGAGDDRIVSGGGADTLAGGAGADVFVFDASTGSDRISDFELHLDRIDLGDWGNLASVSALKINATGTGCMLSYGAHQLSIVTANGQSLSAASFTDADFLF
jgi:Ca2+-binding RTX toxin-like protein